MSATDAHERVVTGLRDLAALLRADSAAPRDEADEQANEADRRAREDAWHFEDWRMAGLEPVIFEGRPVALTTARITGLPLKTIGDEHDVAVNA